MLNILFYVLVVISLTAGVKAERFVLASIDNQPITNFLLVFKVMKFSKLMKRIQFIELWVARLL